MNSFRFLRWSFRIVLYKSVWSLVQCVQCVQCVLSTGNGGILLSLSIFRNPIFVSDNLCKSFWGPRGLFHTLMYCIDSNCSNPPVLTNWFCLFFSPQVRRLDVLTRIYKTDLFTVLTMKWQKIAKFESWLKFKNFDNFVSIFCELWTINNNINNNSYRFKQIVKHRYTAGEVSYCVSDPEPTDRPTFYV